MDLSVALHGIRDLSCVLHVVLHVVHDHLVSRILRNVASQSHATVGNSSSEGVAHHVELGLFLSLSFHYLALVDRHVRFHLGLEFQGLAGDLQVVGPVLFGLFLGRERRSLLLQRDFVACLLFLFFLEGQILFVVEVVDRLGCLVQPELGVEGVVVDVPVVVVAVVPVVTHCCALFLFFVLVAWICDLDYRGEQDRIGFRETKLHFLLSRMAERVASEATV
mmetsp:Transcript_18820/g.38639  ORF Transcript_18820/g.38639 Transcript_18820/m.38639 type:complete len:221 (-) Transcript_18820:16-678(-)